MVKLKFVAVEQFLSESQPSQLVRTGNEASFK